MKRPHHRNSSRGPNPAQGNTLSAIYARAMEQYRNGQYTEALELCRKRLLPLASRNPDILLLAGVLCNLTGDMPAAEGYLEKAVAAGGTSEIYTNLALVQVALHRPDDAEKSYRRAVALDPKQAQAWNNLGNLLHSSFQPERKKESLTCYRNAIAVRPNYASAYANLGFALEGQKDLDGAEENYRLAIKYDPRHLTAILNLADLLERRKRPDEAFELYQQAIAVEPHNTKALGNALSLRRNLADWDEKSIPNASDVIAALRPDKPSALQPLHLLALPEADAELHLSTAKRFAISQWETSLAQPPLVSSPADPNRKRIRVGYISADFRNHPVAHLITDVIASHDREQFEVFLYAYGPNTDGDERRALQQAADHFLVISEMEDGDVAQRIKEDGIDILIDLTGYTTHSRAGISALRPAPTIASWIGYVGTLGESRIADYIIGDAVVTPPESASKYSETLALMPESFQPNCALIPLPPTPTRSEEGLPENAVVFCSFNQIFKLNPQLWDDWCRILKEVPDSVLWLAAISKPGTEDNLRRETALRGVTPERLIFAPRKPLNEHRARIALADIALDTFPYNSGATASDTLRAGVPLVTHMGDTFASRMAGSLLYALGLPELTTSSRDEYVKLAVRLAQNPEERKALREKLNEQLPKSTLFQPKLFTRQVDALLKKMHEQAIAGKRSIIRLEKSDYR